MRTTFELVEPAEIFRHNLIEAAGKLAVALGEEIETAGAIGKASWICACATPLDSAGHRLAGLGLPLIINCNAIDDAGKSLAVAYACFYHNRDTGLARAWLILPAGDAFEGNIDFVTMAISAEIVLRIRNNFALARV